MTSTPRKDEQTPLPTSRKDALAVGSVRFNTGRPCRSGHMSDRYTSTGGCIACLDQQRAQFAAVVREARRPVADKTSRLFAYRLHPDDHAAALAYCQALDLQRGRQPAAAQAATGGPAEPPRMATPEEVQRHRANILERLGALRADGTDPYLPAEFAAVIRKPGDER